MNENNKIKQSLDNIRATEDLKQNTLQYLFRQAEQKKSPVMPQSPIPASRLGKTAQKQNSSQASVRRRHGLKYALAALCVCLFLLLGAGGYAVYRQPVSYISIDVNPSVELGVNRFGRVVSADAYNEDGQAVLRQSSLKNIPYIQAIDRLLANESSFGFLDEDSLLVFTVASAQDTSASMSIAASIMEDLNTAAFSQKYETLLYTSDAACMEEAHSHEMSFGKYRGYQELLQYDTSVTIEDCHNMTMEELHDRIEGCSGHQGGDEGQHHGESESQQHGGAEGQHHGGHHN